MSTPIVEQATETRKYGARPGFIVALLLLTGVGVLGSGYVTAHERHVGIIMWMLTGLYLLLLATVVSLRVGVREDGILQGWLFNRAKVLWRDVARVDKTARGYAVRGADGKDVALLFLLSPTAQQSIADAAIARARLRPVKQVAPPLVAQWERKGK